MDFEDKFEDKKKLNKSLTSNINLVHNKSLPKINDVNINPSNTSKMIENIKENLKSELIVSIKEIVSETINGTNTSVKVTQVQTVFDSKNDNIKDEILELKKYLNTNEEKIKILEKRSTEGERINIKITGDVARALNDLAKCALKEEMLNVTAQLPG